MKIRFFTRQGVTIFEGEAPSIVAIDHPQGAHQPGIGLTLQDAEGLTLREVQRLMWRGECCLEIVDAKRDQPTPVKRLEERVERPERRTAAVAGADKKA
jgi:hypothetical protein